MGNNSSTFDTSILSPRNLEDFSQTDIKPILQTAKSYQRRGQYQNAIINFKKASKINPYSTYIYTKIASCYFRIGDFVRAITEYRRAVDLSPQNKFAWNGLGVAYQIVENDQLSIECFMKAISIDKSFSYPYNGLGNLYKSRGNFEEALVNYQIALRLNPKNIVILTNIASCCLFANKNKQAQLYIKKVSQIYQKQDLNGTNKSYVQMKVKQFKEKIQFQYQAYRKSTRQSSTI